MHSAFQIQIKIHLVLTQQYLQRRHLKYSNSQSEQLKSPTKKCAIITKNFKLLKPT